MSQPHRRHRRNNNHRLHSNPPATFTIMKSLFTRLIVRSGLLVAFASATVVTAVAAPEVTVNLSGATFGNGLDVHVNSGTQTIFPAKSYGYEIEGTVHG